LEPGDVLYLPRGWWHAVSADQGVRSLHLTCGLTPHTGADLIGWLSETLRECEQVRADLPLHARPEAQAAYLNGLREQLLAALDAPGVLERFAAARDGEDLGRLRSALPHLTGLPADWANHSARCPRYLSSFSSCRIRSRSLSAAGALTSTPPTGVFSRRALGKANRRGSENC
jgi:hypothetical protein